MTERIPSQVARNRRNVKRIDGQFISVPSEVQQNLRFLRNTVDVSVTVDVYTRSLGTSLISGHPDGSTHGSGHGVSGDERGAWTQQVSGGSTHEWTRDGRNALRDALDGQDGAVASGQVGTGSTAADPSDAALVAETGSTFAYGVKDAGNITRARSNYLFSEYGAAGVDQPQEFSIEDATGRLMARATSSSAVAVSADEELRVDVSVTISGHGAGSSVITSAGETALADSIQTLGTTVGLDSIAWGTGTPVLAKATTALTNQVTSKTAQRTTDLERIEVTAPQFAFEPTGQPYDYTEVGVLDNSGRLVWLSGMDAYHKDANTQFTTSIGFRLR